MKILVTVGSAPHPFKRLVEAADDLAGKTGGEVIIQYGFTKTKLKHAQGFDFVPYEKMTELFQNADLIISHASAGPVLFTEQHHKKLILFPRSGDRGEHVDNHQIGFASALRDKGADWEIVFDEKELPAAVEKTLKQPSGIKISHQRGEVASEIAEYLKTTERRKNAFKSTAWRKLKELLYFLRVYRFLASLRNHTFWMLRGGYRPKDFWNKWSTYYISEKSRSTIGPSHEWLLEKIQKYRSGRILEAGSGFGRTLDYLQGRTHGLSFYGADISIEMLSYGRRQFPAVAERTLCTDMVDLPFPKASFTAVYTRGVLMHCVPEKLEAVLKELERVSQGELILIEETFWDMASNQGKSFSLNDYTFIHDYSALLEKLGWVVSEKKVLDDGMLVLICLVCSKRSEGQDLRGAKAAQSLEGVSIIRD